MSNIKSIGFCVTERIKELMMSKINMSLSVESQSKVRYMLENCDQHLRESDPNSDVYIWDNATWEDFDIETVKMIHINSVSEWFSQFFKNMDNQGASEEFLYVCIEEDRSTCTILGDYTDNDFGFGTYIAFTHRGV